MLTIDPKETTVQLLQTYLQSAVGPRPIALASTVNASGTPNLAPFSFFNVFSANPPVLIFSPARRVRDSTLKHTLLNCEATKEVVINVVNYEMVQQSSLASSEYAEGVNEFIKAGFTAIPSRVVKPFRVKESPVQFECKVTQIISLGNEGGAGNLILCEVLKMYIDEAILDANQAIDQYKIDLVARLGSNWYTRSNAGLFEVEKPITNLGIGVAVIPDSIKKSPIFDGNDLGKLGNIEALPTKEEVTIFVKENFAIKAVLSADDSVKKHLEAKKYLNKGDVFSAWKVLLAEK
ncbi:flavin reductase family protein [Flavobacterium agrisoli]|uniref:Flavin reductase family protein n=1 Tax=Flavobacterium agrisoli TaxID=2793066 RepID=A0A934PMM9_9FLAO|nr:flavin reductase family protein [Flavobacterium agrisoli]MBK0371006.1 flavin reductase family protein [Flavobacterium agrisoli]